MAKQQGAVGGTVLAGDAPQLGGLGTGVIQATDQVVDGRAAGIDQQQHRGHGCELVPWGLEKVLPGFCGPIEIGKLGRVDGKRAQLGPREPQQGDAQGRRMLEFVGLAGGIGAHDPAPHTAQPVLGLQLALQQGQQALQVAGVAGGGKHQGQIGWAAPLQLLGNGVHGPLQRGFRGKGSAAPGGLGTGALQKRQPARQGKGSHGLTLSPAGGRG